MPVKSTKDGKFWREQIESALAVRRQYEPAWQKNLDAYAPKASEVDTYAAQINTNRDFTLVERKKSDLFYQRPDVTLQPTPLSEQPILGPDGQPVQGQPGPDGQPQTFPQALALQSHQEITNEKLGADGVDAVRMVHQTLFDVLCTQGTGFTVMGYEAVTVEVEQEVQVGEEPSPESILGLGPAQPIFKKVKVPVPVHEHCYWQHISGKRAIIPHDYRSTEWDRAPFLGHQFELLLTPANREKFKLPADFQPKSTDERQYYDHGTSASRTGGDKFTGVELWYRSSLFREDIKHPEHLTHLVIVDGINEPVIEEDCPYQTLDARGGLTPDSLIGFPIHPLNVRTLTDSAYPPSDCTLIRPLVNELNRSREQNLEFRDAATLKWIYNTDTLPEASVGKMVRSPIGGMIGVPPEAFHGEGAIKELPHGSMPRENFAIQDYIDGDIARTTAIDASGSGVQSSVNQTATEAQIQQGNANARLDFERGVVLQWYVKGVTKFSTLIQRYLPVEQAAQIVGPERAQMWDVWRKQADSRLAFTALPDSALRVDQAVDRKQMTDFYSYIANDPYCQSARPKLLEKLFRKHHVDPTGQIVPPQPAKPEPPKLSFAFKGEDLVGPQAPIVLGIAEQLGLKIDPAWVQLSQAMAQASAQLAMQADAEQAAAKAQGDTRHGGKLAPQENLSKHASDMTGGMQGSGMPAAMGAPGGQLQ